MPSIKFSHDYPKLHGQTSAKLLAVEPLTLDANTPRALIEYDTRHDGGYYELKHGNYIQLVFLGNLRIPFCTIRTAYRSSKVDFYKKNIGATFNIQIIRN